MRSAEQALVLITRALINRSNIVNLQLAIISHPATTVACSVATQFPVLFVPNQRRPGYIRIVIAARPFRIYERALVAVLIVTRPVSISGTYVAGVQLDVGQRSYTLFAQVCRAPSSPPSSSPRSSRRRRRRRVGFALLPSSPPSRGCSGAGCRCLFPTLMTN